MEKKVKQVSVFLENTLGRLDEILRVLSDSGIDLIGLSIADTSNFGLLRLIVDNPEKALEVLKTGGYTAKITDIFALAVPDSPGGLADIMKKLKETGVSIEYLYSLVRTIENMAVLILRVDDEQKAEDVFEVSGIKLLSHKEIIAT